MLSDRWSSERVLRAPVTRVREPLPWPGSPYLPLVLSFLRVFMCSHVYAVPTGPRRGRVRASGTEVADSRECHVGAGNQKMN